MSHRWELSAVGGVATIVMLWLVLVPWDLSAGSTVHIVAGAGGAVIIAAIVGGAVTFADRVAGRAFVVTAYLTALLVFMAQSIAAGDVFWPVTLLLLALVALGCFVLAFAVGRALRTRSTVIGARRQRPPVVVQVIVWLGLAILMAVVGAFVWLFVLGHGF